jgi:hypothetical protein
LNGHLKTVLAVALLFVLIVVNAEARLPIPASLPISFTALGDIDPRTIEMSRLIPSSRSGTYSLSFLVETNNPRSGTVSIPFPKTGVPSDSIPYVQVGGNDTQAYAPVQSFSENGSGYLVMFAWQPLVLPRLNILNIQFTPRQFPALVDYFAISLVVVLVGAIGEAVLLAKKNAASIRVAAQRVPIRPMVLSVAMGVGLFLLTVFARAPGDLLSHQAVLIADTAIIGLGALLVLPLGGTITAGTVGVLLSGFDPTDAAFALIVWILFGLTVDGLFAIFQPLRSTGQLNVVRFVSVIAFATIATALADFALVVFLVQLPANPIAEFGLKCPSLVLDCHPSGTPLGIVGAAILAMTWQFSRRYLWK